MGRPTKYAEYSRQATQQNIKIIHPQTSDNMSTKFARQQTEYQGHSPCVFRSSIKIFCPTCDKIWV